MKNTPKRLNDPIKSQRPCKRTNYVTVKKDPAMAAAKAHIEEIRKNRFWIGVGKNPLSKSLRSAVKFLSTELYSKDVHFLMELIQNAEDNEYPHGVEPSLEFIITSQDITATGAPTTLLIFNNEKGFSRKDMESICNVGDSTKAGNRKHGYIGEKGIGFKSVFMLTAQPYIFSSGYQVRFNETPCPECDIAYIVPEWIDNKPYVSDIHRIYGQNRILPTTTIILPLKPDKVKAVKEQLSSVHPELLLFLSKIKQFSVKEDNMDPSLGTIREISISSEKDFVAKKNIDAESYTIHLTAAEGGNNKEDECCYYMWRQRFPVSKENKVERRIDIEEWVITLAFPFGRRLDRGMKSAGLYAFLPTETITNFPFIIQADFLLPSSRETILWDDKWNQGILDCVPKAFINAFVSLVKTREDAPASSLAPMFAFVPIKTSCHPKLNVIRDLIKVKLLQESIIPSESHSKQNFFHKPGEVGRLTPSFWSILVKAKSQGAKLHNLSSHGVQVLNSSFDIDKYNDVLIFLGIQYVDYEWYPKCIRSCNLVSGAEEDVYQELLYFVAVNWNFHLIKTSMRSIPLLKYVSASGNVSLFSINETTGQYTLCRSLHAKHISWLIDWSKEFRSATQVFFLPEKTRNYCTTVNAIDVWLRDCANVKTLGVYEFASLIHKSLVNSPVLVVAFAHFLHLSSSMEYLSNSETKQLCSTMPLLNAYGGVSVAPKGVLVPANASKWAELLGSNLWRNEDYVELADEYIHSGHYAGQYVAGRMLINFLQRYAGASDIPDIVPPDASFPTVSGPLTKQNAFLLLDWICKLKSNGIKVPSRFLSCIKNGSWLKVTVSGSPGYKPPSQSFLPSSSWDGLLQSGSDMVDIPLVDQGFYNNKIQNYEQGLKAVGVMSERTQACHFISKHLMSLAANDNLTRAKVLAMLSFINFLRVRNLQIDEFISSIKNVKWVRTSCGERSPVESVLFDPSWQTASAISQIPFLDQCYYGDEILTYKTELSLLGVMVGFQGNFQIVIDNLKPSPSLTSLNAEPLIFTLECIRSSGSSGKLVASLKEAKCLRSNIGYMSPGECFLLDSEWGCILEVFEGFPCVDGGFYGSKIYQYKEELSKIGVVVDFDVAMKAFSNKFRQLASSNSFTKENVLLFLASYRKLSKSCSEPPTELQTCVQEAKWLRTRLGDCRSPKDCILFSVDWRPISRITLLPFIDDSSSCYGKGIHNYEDELKSMGVVVDFKKGAQFVLSHVSFPQDPIDIIPGAVISLLKCIRNSEPGDENPLPEPFLEKVHQTKWLKTTVGYMSPQECILFERKQNTSLQLHDGPFLDERYYGRFALYKEELAAIGVTIDMNSSEAYSLLSNYIKSHSELAKIERIYAFLSKSDWEPDSGSHNRIWIPSGYAGGMWVTPQECVLHDDNGLFNSRLHVLHQKYKPKLLTFFSRAFGVRRTPSTDDYCMLWREWEKTRPVLSKEECCAFWGHVIKHWSPNTEKLISESVAKIPAGSGDSGDIMLINKQDVFLPDDLLLKDLFEESSPCTLFVWCPMGNLPSFSRDMLLDIYGKIGVRTITESVSMSELSALKCGQLKRVSPKDVFIVKGLVMLILGFLSDSTLNIEAKRRHETVKALLKVSVFETPEPIMISYNLTLTSGNVVKVSTSQMVRWERDTSKFFTQKLDKEGGFKNLVEYATKFAEVVSEGLLWGNEDKMPKLSELIKFGFLMNFDEAAVAYFMKSRNLQIFTEDEKFLSSAFPSC